MAEPNAWDGYLRGTILLLPKAAWRRMATNVKVSYLQYLFALARRSVYNLKTMFPRAPARTHALSWERRLEASGSKNSRAADDF